jgi:hypothetical protein
MLTLLSLQIYTLVIHTQKNTFIFITVLQNKYLMSNSFAISKVYCSTRLKLTSRYRWSPRSRYDTSILGISATLPRETPRKWLTVKSCIIYFCLTDTAENRIGTASRWRCSMTAVINRLSMSTVTQGDRRRNCRMGRLSSDEMFSSLYLLKQCLNNW